MIALACADGLQIGPLSSILFDVDAGVVRRWYTLSPASIMPKEGFDWATWCMMGKGVHGSRLAMGLRATCAYRYERGPIAAYPRNGERQLCANYGLVAMVEIKTQWNMWCGLFQSEDITLQEKTSRTSVQRRNILGGGGTIQASSASYLWGNSRSNSAQLKHVETLVYPCTDVHSCPTDTRGSFTVQKKWIPRAYSRHWTDGEPNRSSK